MTVPDRFRLKQGVRREKKGDPVGPPFLFVSNVAHYCAGAATLLLA